MQWQLVNIRFAQLKRELDGLGVLYAILLLALFPLAIYFIYLSYQHPSNARLVSIAIITLVLVIHFTRKDVGFVYKHLRAPALTVFSEYVIFTLPFLSPCLFTMHYWHYPICLIALWGISHVRPVIRGLSVFLPWLSGIIPAKDFEWLSGVRKRFITLSALLLLAVAISWIRIAPLFFLWMAMVTITSFYQYSEPRQMLISTSQSAREFLHTKIIRHAKFVLIVMLPILAINTTFHPSLFLVNLAFVVLQLMLLVCFIVAKYAIYAPNKTLESNSVILSVAGLGAIIPFLLPIPLVLILFNYRKAIRTLKPYFDD